MTSDFYAIWRQFQGKQDEDQLPLCPIAAEFSAKLHDVVFTPLSQFGEQGITRGIIAEAKLLLLDEFKAWEKAMPPHHFLGRHQCLTTVFDQGYDKLHLLDLRLRPRLNLILDYEQLTRPVVPVASAPPAPVDQIAGILIGELAPDE